MIRKLAVLILLPSLGAFAQSAFEVASIRPSQSGRETIEAARGVLTMRSVRLERCIRWAYGVQSSQVSGPSWLNEATFDIVAKAGASVDEGELRLMLRTLLAERFQMQLHRETRDVPALILTIGKNGHKLQATEAEGTPSFKTGKMNLTGQGATLNQLTDFLAGELRRPIIDQTGLTGRFNYFLDINSYVTEEVLKSQGPGGGPPPDAPSIVAQAIQAQLGLRLESKKAPLEVLVIDRMERTPTEN